MPCCYQLLWFELLQNTTFHLLLGLVKTWHW